MILINNVKLNLDTDFNNLRPIVAKNLKLPLGKIISAELYKKSVDARHKNNVHFCCSLLAKLSVDESLLIEKNKNLVLFSNNEYSWLKSNEIPENKPVVVGFGPAGMFAALTLAKAGLKPIVIERGSCVEKRKKAVDDFFNGKTLNPECNVQFGEGGAGTFSDGKLTTGIKNPKCRIVIETLYKMGANKNILTDSKPHIGTDILCKVVKNIREEIISLGGEILFDTKLENIIMEDNKIVSVIANKKCIPCNNLIIATGHSARDTYKMLLKNGIEMVQKPFSVGVRIEHLQKDINYALYGEFADNPNLSAADYKLATHLENGRGVYTFCMCPGGEVINSSSEIGGIAVNGMSYSRRDGDNSNSAVLVSVETEDFNSDDVLAGCLMQEKIEKAAFEVRGGAVPINTVGNFVYGEEFKLGRIKPSIKPEWTYSDFKEIFPEFVIKSLKLGIKEFGKKISGFDCSDAVLTAPETRSSAPVRILRKENCESISVNGIYPCGEGAGYAGGIVSAAVDGIKVAEEIIKFINKC